MEKKSYYFSLVWIGLVFLMGGCLLDGGNDNNNGVLLSTTTSTATTPVTVSGSVTFPNNTVIAKIQPTISGAVNFTSLRVYINGTFYGLLNALGQFSFTNVTPAVEYRVEIKNPQDILLLISIDNALTHAINATSTARALVLQQARATNPALILANISATSQQVLNVIALIEPLFSSTNSLTDSVTLASKSILSTPTLLNAVNTAAQAVVANTTTAGSTTTTSSTTSTTSSGSNFKPTGTLTINNGDAATNSRQVTLTISNIQGFEITGMSIDGGSFTPLQLVSNYNLSTGNGSKTVKLILRDRLGNTSNEITDSIELAASFKVTTLTPFSGQEFVPLKSVITANFDQKVATSTISTTTFSVGVAGIVTSGGMAASFTPSTPLASDTTFWITLNASIGNQLQDMNLGSAKISSFTTGHSRIDCGDEFSLVLLSSGLIKGFGKNNCGQLGNGTTTDSPTPVLVKGEGGVALSLDRVTEISCGGAFALTLRSDNNNGYVYSFGDNSSSQLGDGTKNNRSLPGKVLGGATGLAYLKNIWGFAAGSKHCLAVQNWDTVWSWGGNFAGELGDNSTTERSTPVQVLAGAAGGTYLQNIGSVAAGEHFSLATRYTDGTVWSWGKNSQGQLGDNSTTNRLTPVAVSGLTNITAIAAGAGHGLALRNDGTVWAWGANSAGQLGLATTTTQLTPQQVKGGAASGTFLTNITAIAAGASHSLCLRNDGRLFAFGGNSKGQLGKGDTADIASAALVLGAGTDPALQNVVGIFAGGNTGVNHSLVFTNDGSLYSFGANDAKQLGDGTTTPSNRPLRITAINAYQ